MNRNITTLNNGKFHQPILKVRVYEKADKFAVGQAGNKAKKLVEAAKGTNLFFAFFGTEKENKQNGKKEVVRSYMTIPLNVMIDCQKKYGIQWRNNIEDYLREKDMIDADAKLLFILSPNDLVYLPKEGNQQDMEKERIYKFVSASNYQAFFIPYYIASPVIQNKELGSNNKSERAWTGEMIKETCIPTKVDRLGNIIETGVKHHK